MTAALLEHPAAAIYRRPRLIPAPDVDPPLTLTPMAPDWPLAIPLLPQPISSQRRARDKSPASKEPRIDCRRFAPTPASLPVAAQPARLCGAQMSRIRSEETPTWATDHDCGVLRTSATVLPPAADWATVCCRGIIESLAGRRPVDQLRKHCSPEIFAGLKDRAPSRPTSTNLLLTVTVCQPTDGVAEVAAVFRADGRARAMALRMQGLDGRWRITDLQMA